MAKKSVPAVVAQPDEKRSRTITIRLTETQHRRLREHLLALELRSGARISQQVFLVRAMEAALARAEGKR